MIVFVVSEDGQNGAKIGLGVDHQTTLIMSGTHPDCLLLESIQPHLFFGGPDLKMYNYAVMMKRSQRTETWGFCANMRVLIYVKPLPPIIDKKYILNR